MKNRSTGNSRRISRRAPDQPLPPQRRDFGGREWIAALQAIGRGPHERDRKQGRYGLKWQRRYALVRCAEMAAPEVS
jgi:hypothetical protein